MKAEELKFNNWVFDGEKYQKITGVYHDRVYFGSGWALLEIVEPIPLTPEILEKAGWDNVNDKTAPFYDFGKFSLTRQQPVFTAYYNSCKIIGHVKYVHQLQNLYFALTSSELPINL